jgi:hypothetical protein
MRIFRDLWHGRGRINVEILKPISHVANMTLSDHCILYNARESSKNRDTGYVATGKRIPDVANVTHNDTYTSVLRGP